MTAATTGINETNAKKSGLEVDTVILSPMSHAGYYPGGKVMTLSLIHIWKTLKMIPRRYTKTAYLRTSDTAIYARCFDHYFTSFFSHALI